MYRTRFFGQAVGLCGAPERVVMPSGASVVRASVAVLLDEPFGVVTVGKVANGVSDFVDGLEDTAIEVCSVKVRNRRSMTPLICGSRTKA